MIGARALILRNIHIGEGARFGANSVVLSNVTTSSTAVGVPTKVIKYNYIARLDFKTISKNHYNYILNIF